MSDLVGNPEDTRRGSFNTEGKMAIFRSLSALLIFILFELLFCLRHLICHVVSQNKNDTKKSLKTDNKKAQMQKKLAVI